MEAVKHALETVAHKVTGHGKEQVRADRPTCQFNANKRTLAAPATSTSASHSPCSPVTHAASRLHAAYPCMLLLSSTAPYPLRVFRLLGRAANAVFSVYKLGRVHTLARSPHSTAVHKGVINLAHSFRLRR